MLTNRYECKACSGELEIIKPGIGRCIYCGKKQPIPMVNNEQFLRANKLRLDNKDFEKAMQIYADILKDSPEEADAYWGIVLCRYGIEYVTDIDGKQLPTCHRTIDQSILLDADYNLAIMYASQEAKEYYIEQARYIDVYQKKIKHVVSMEEPYDIFISFKAVTNDGMATTESRYAQKLYNYLSKDLKLKVFFSPVSLKNRLGEEYEPIIFAALKSAKVMVLVAASNKAINSAWIKNEWSRFARMSSSEKVQGNRKKLIPALINMSVEELPTELAGLQAIDITKPLELENMCNNIDIFIGQSRVIEQKTDAEEFSANEALKFVNLGRKKLRKSDFFEAKDYFDRALEKNPQCAEAYWGRILADYMVEEEEILPKRMIKNLEECEDYIEAVRYGTKEEIEFFESVNKTCISAYAESSKRMKYVDDYDEEYKQLFEAYKYNSVDNALMDNQSRVIINEYVKYNNKEEEIREKIRKSQERAIISKPKFIAFVLILLVGMIPSIYLLKYYNMVDDYAKEYKLDFGELFNNHETVDSYGNKSDGEAMEIIRETISDYNSKINRRLIYIYIVMLIISIVIAIYRDKSIINYIFIDILVIIGHLLFIKLLKYMIIEHVAIMVIVLLIFTIAETRFLVIFLNNIRTKIFTNKMDDELETCILNKEKAIIKLAEDSVRTLKNLNHKYQNTNPTYGINIEYKADDKIYTEIVKMIR